jgi:hypothetical protein
MTRGKRKKKYDQPKRGSEQQRPQPNPAIAPPTAKIAAKGDREAASGQQPAGNQHKWICPHCSEWFNWLAHPRRLNLIFSGCVAFFAFVQGCTSWLQWDATRNQYSAMLSDLRPWVVLETPTLSMPLTVGEKAACDGVATNEGRSPAFVFFEGSAMAVVFVPEDESKFAYDDYFKIESSSPSDAPNAWKWPLAQGRGMTGIICARDVLDEQTLNDIKNRRRTLMVTTVYRYVDTSKCAHKTLACWTYDPDADIFRRFGRYNEMD